jgi:hypothetical protein
MLNTLTKFSGAKQFDLTSLEVLAFGGSPMPVELYRRTRRMLPARPGLKGNTGSNLSNAWMALFSSTQNTAALTGGLRYRPMISAAFSSNSGSLLET